MKSMMTNYKKKDLPFNLRLQNNYFINSLIIN